MNTKRKTAIFAGSVIIMILLVLVISTLTGYGDLFQGYLKPYPTSTQQAPQTVKIAPPVNTLYTTKGVLAKKLVDLIGEDVSSYKSCITDVNGNVNENAICYLRSLGVIAPGSDGKFNPTNTITRGDAAVIVGGTLFKAEVEYETKATSKSHSYYDLYYHQWLATYVDAMAKYDIFDVTPYGPNTFRPNDLLKSSEYDIWLTNLKTKAPILKQMNKSDMAVYIGQALEQNPVDKNCASDIAGAWYENYACYLMNIGVMNDATDGKFHADTLLNRGQAAKYLALAFIGQDAILSDNLSYYSDLNSYPDYVSYVNALAKNGVIDTPANTNSRFRPADPINRFSFEKWMVKSKTLTPPSRSNIQLIAPPDGTDLGNTSQFINYVWSIDPSAVSYDIQIRNQNSSEYHFNQNTTGSVYSSWQNVVPGSKQKYYWRVVVHLNNGDTYVTPEFSYSI